MDGIILKKPGILDIIPRGSLFETKTWLTKAHNRKLIESEDFKNLIAELDVIGKMLNNYIKSIGRVSEPEEDYNTTPNSDQ